MEGPILGADAVWMDLMRALGLDPNKTQDVTLHLPMDGAAIIEAKLLVDEIGDYTSIVERRFVLVEESDAARYKRDNPESTFGLVIESPSGTYAKAYPLDMAGDPKYREMIMRGLEQALDDLAKREVVSK